MPKLSTATTQVRKPFTQNRLMIGLLLLFIASWITFFFYNVDRTDWFIENILVFLFFIYLFTSYKYYQFSDVTYICFFLFLMLHVYGATYAYTHNPIGDWMKQTWHLWRNPYDRIVHFSFGLLLAYPIRDMLINRIKVKGRWQYILPVEITLSLACIFELIEWGVAETTDKVTGETYVATQGDVWDAHKDIAVAVVGAAITMFVVYLYKKRNNKVA